MGLTPDQVWKMSVWEFAACRDGWNKAHGAKEDRGDAGEFTDERLRELGIEGFAT